MVWKIGLGKEVLSWRIVAKNLRSVKVNVKKSESVKNSQLGNWWENVRNSKKCKSENWYQKLLSQKIGICEKTIQSWKIGRKHFKLENRWKKISDYELENFVRNFFVGKFVLKNSFWIWKSVLVKAVKRINFQKFLHHNKFDTSPASDSESAVGDRRSRYLINKNVFQQKIVLGQNFQFFIALPIILYSN